MADSAPTTTAAPVAEDQQISPFFRIPPTISPTSTCPSIIHLKRDHHLAVTFAETDPPSFVRTRFGEFAHSSFINQPYGSQIRASTKTPQHNSRKRKRAENAENADSESGTPTAGTASSGFVHVLAPTAELWTASLPHRTQVVYTPDSSYVLHRLNVHAGSVVIEAGAGSGSFTHASARAVYNGYPTSSEDTATTKRGKVCSFEFHNERADKLRTEINNHGLANVVEITHRDVCKDGFLLPRGEAFASPNATAIFLDLPAPWLALPHLTREVKDGRESALDPNHNVRICCFSPCMEQVTRTVAVLRELGWLDIEMDEVQHTRIEVRRQTPKGYAEGAGPRTISEALGRLREVNQLRDARRTVQIAQSKGEDAELVYPDAKGEKGGRTKEKDPDAGRLVTRTEPELKTHTSYLTFATMPRAWTEEMEEEARREVEGISEGVDKGTVGEKEKKWKQPEMESKRQKKRREREERKRKEAEEAGEGEGEEREDAEEAPKGDKMEVDA